MHLFSRFNLNISVFKFSTMASELSHLTSSLASALSNLPAPEKIPDGERMQLLGIINKLQEALEPPQLPLQRFCFSVRVFKLTKIYILCLMKWNHWHGHCQHYGIAVIRIAQGMGIFEAFIESQGQEIPLEELSSKVKGDDRLLSKQCCSDTARGTC